MGRAFEKVIGVWRVSGIEQRLGGEADVIEKRGGGGGPLAQTCLSRILWAQQPLLQLVPQ